MNKIDIPGIEVRHYESIRERDEGFDRYPDALHILRMENEVWGDTDLIVNFGNGHLFSARYDGQSDRTRVDWSPSPNLDKKSLVERVVTNYSSLICLGDFEDQDINADIQMEYKTQGDKVEFSAKDFKRGLDRVYSHQKFDSFQGLVFSGHKTKEARWAIFGLDTVSENPWDFENGDVFVETDANLGEWFVNLYNETSNLVDSGLIDFLPKLIQNGINLEA
jgi:hypothetical protein